MQKLITAVLVVANLSALFFLVQLLLHGGKAQVKAQDLLSCPVDLDGDGNCTPPERVTLDQLLEAYPDLIDRALEDARFLPNGGIDLSSFLMQFGLRAGEITLYRKGRIVKVKVSEENKIHNAAHNEKE